eukprot:6030739-Pyramimonas_sp.AAC.2
MASSLTDLCSALADLQAQVSALDGNGVSNNAEESCLCCDTPGSDKILLTFAGSQHIPFA